VEEALKIHCIEFRDTDRTSISFALSITNQYASTQCARKDPGSGSYTDTRSHAPPNADLNSDGKANTHTDSITHSFLNWHTFIGDSIRKCQVRCEQWSKKEFVSDFSSQGCDSGR
jgi:hypothetical protein